MFSTLSFFLFLIHTVLRHFFPSISISLCLFSSLSLFPSLLNLWNQFLLLYYVYLFDVSFALPNSSFCHYVSLSLIFLKLL
jgi:hypothetical protein